MNERKKDTFNLATEETGRRIGYNPYLKEVSPFEGHDIDYPEDFAMAEAIVSTSGIL